LAIGHQATQTLCQAKAENLTCPFERTHITAPFEALFWGNKYWVLITEITQHLPTYIARVRLQGQVITTTIAAANHNQARTLLTHLYGVNNLLSLSRP
jgi:hypothetical protein